VSFTVNHTVMAPHLIYVSQYWGYRSAILFGSSHFQLVLIACCWLCLNFRLTMNITFLVPFCLT